MSRRCQPACPHASQDAAISELNHHSIGMILTRQSSDLQCEGCSVARQVAYGREGKPALNMCCRTCSRLMGRYVAETGALARTIAAERLCAAWTAGRCRSMYLTKRIK